MDTRRKLIILADAAKVDASCASSTTTRLLSRRARRVRWADLYRLKVPVAKVLPFVSLPDHLSADRDGARLRCQVQPRAEAASGAPQGLAGSPAIQSDLFA